MLQHLIGEIQWVNILHPSPNVGESNKHQEGKKNDSGIVTVLLEARYSALIVTLKRTTRGLEI